MSGFKVKKFNSGEYEVTLLDTNIAPKCIHWNWFKEPDIMIPLMKADAVRRVFGNVQLDLIADYIPFQRQERLFEFGGSIPLDILTKILSQYFMGVLTLCFHDYLNAEAFYRFKRFPIEFDGVICFPDASASMHFFNKTESFVIDKRRLMTTNEGIVLSTLSLDAIKSIESNDSKRFLICDDICDGGRTFVNAAKIISDKVSGAEISLLVVNGFITHGLDDLKESGIKEIFIVNPDSYEYLLEKYNEPEYIKQWGVE